MNEKVSEGSSIHVPRSHVNRNRGSFWTTSAVAIIGVVVFSVLVVAAVRLLDLRLAGSAMLAATLILTLIPALLWMSAFYMLDREEPEPRSYVLGIFALGGLAALVFGIHIVRDLFATQDWLGRTPWYTQLLGSIVIVGMVQEFCKYAVVRYTIYFSAEFDERIDGIIYGAAAGLGFGTILAIQHLLSAGGAQLDMAAMRIAVITLAQASFGGLTGYFIGRAKFDDMGPWWLPAGLVISAVFNGSVTWLLGEVSTQGLAVTPQYGLIMAAVVAAGMFGFLAWQTRRLASSHAHA